MTGGTCTYIISGKKKDSTFASETLYTMNINFNKHERSIVSLIESFLLYLIANGKDIEFLHGVGNTSQYTDLRENIKSIYNSKLDAYIKEKLDKMIFDESIDECDVKALKSAQEAKMRKMFSIDKYLTNRALHETFETMNIDYDAIHKKRIEKLDVYSSANEMLFNTLIDKFVDNFGFADIEFTKFALRRWFKASKCIMSYNDDVKRSLCLLFVSNNNFTGKSTVQNAIAEAFAETFITETYNTDLERMAGTFSFLPTKPSVLVLNECYLDNKISSNKIKDILGNQPVDINQKGVRNLIHSENKNIYIGSSNEFVHLRNMVDTRFLNIPIDRLKYTTKHHKNAYKQIVEFVKEIIKYAPMCDGDEIAEIIEKLPSWNNSRGDDQKWKTLLYELYTIDNSDESLEEWNTITDSNIEQESISDWLRKIIVGANSKGAIAGKIAETIVEKHGLDSKFKSIYQHQIMKSDLIVRKYPNSSFGLMTINENFFDGFSVSTEIDNDLESLLPWSQSPIYTYFHPLPPLDPTPGSNGQKFFGCDDAKHSSQVYETTFEEGTQYIVVNEPKDNAIENTSFDRMIGKNTIARCKNNFKMNRFIFESDEASLEEQLQNAKRIEPVSMSCTFSGGKSYHILVNTNYNGNDKECYRFLYRKLAQSLFPNIKYDKQLEGDTIRLCRKPNGIRKDEKHQNVIQSLEYYHPDHVIDVSKWVEEYEFDKQFATKTSKTSKLYNIDKNNSFYKNDYHNLPAVKNAINAKKGERESLANTACYSMLQNGYKEYIADMLYECPLDSEDRNNLINQYGRK